MKLHQTFYAFVLLCLMTVQGKSAQEVHPEVTLAPWRPWEVISFSYIAYKKIFESGVLVRVERVPGKAINVFEAYEALTGFHPHNGTPRDGGHWISSTRQITDANGEAFFDYRANGYAGTIRFTLIPEDQGLPVERIKMGLWVRDHDYLGNEQLFVALGAGSYTMDRARHLDTRHGDSVAGPYYSRYGTRASVQMMQDLAYKYYQKSALGLQLDVLPSGLPDGGIGDFRMSAAANSPYTDAEWRAPPGALMMYGTEWNIANPKYQAGSTFGVSEYDRFEEWVYKVGCKTAFANDNGVFLSNKDGHTGYWPFADVVRVTCSAAPWVAH